MLANGFFSVTPHIEQVTAPTYVLLLFLIKLISSSSGLIFQLQQPDKAAAAAHTYFQANPEHVEMGQDLEQYKDLQGVNEDHFVDREARPHQVICKLSVSFLKMDIN